MNFIGKALVGITASMSVMVPVQAGTFQEHIQLANGVESVGVDFILNPSMCETKSALGWYHARHGHLVVCQENAKPGGKEVTWTAEDLDTLRHEAHHLVQDCMNNALDGDLSTVYQSPSELIKNVLTKEQILSVLEWYDDAPDHIKLMELEAFAVAIMNDPAEQLRDINRYCF